MSLIITRTVCNGELAVGITTREFGEFHPARADFPAKLNEIRNLTCGVVPWVFPSLAFSRGIAREKDLLEIAPSLFRTWNKPEDIKIGFKADATIVRYGKGYGLGICNADCPLGIGITDKNPKGERFMFAVHLGLMCMISKREDELSILELLVEELYLKGIIPSQISFWMGFGATWQTYGLSKEDDRWPKINKWQGDDLLVQFGPREGDPAVDLGKIAFNQLIHCGLLPARIEIDPYDTVLGALDSPLGATHWSNLMGHGKTARNFCGTWAPR